MVVVEDVPALHCSACGETYFSAETLHALEEAKKSAAKSTAVRPVHVATLR